MVKSLKERINEILIKSNLLTQEKLEEALSIQKEKGGNLGKILVESGFVKEKDLLGVLSSELNIPPINCAKLKIDQDILKLIPERIARQYHLIPISKLGDTLTICMADPLNVFAIDDIKSLTHYKIDMVVSTERDVQEALNNYYGAGSVQIREILEEVKESGEEVIEIVEHEKIDLSQVAEESKAPPIVQVVNLMIAEALKRRASDIHIEPQEKYLRIRYRIDGNLQEALTIPKERQNAILARLKIISGLDITESRLPQDGRFKITQDDKEVDFRVSVLPVQDGGKVVLRALDKSNLSIGLDKLGFLPEPLEVFKEAVKKPYGMILITGPTGSGKSTTLYSIIQQLNTPDRNIITVEDPVEYQIEGITQIQVKPDIGLTFASGLRSLLRQSPDIILVGEIRDAETADIAIKASLTGQLVLSTLHTNDAAGAITRLIDMGVEPFLIASSLILAAAQRLCRKICPHCKEETEISRSVIERQALKYDPKAKFYKGKGCSRCNNTGYRGRMGILEVFMVDDKIREMIISRASSDQIKQYLISKGMMILRDGAMKNFQLGTTTLEEALRITSEE